MTISELVPRAGSAQSPVDNVHPHLQALVQLAKARGPARVAVAYPCDASSLGAALQAHQAGLITPVLVGPAARIQAVADAEGLDPALAEDLWRRIIEWSIAREEQFLGPDSP